MWGFTRCSTIANCERYYYYYYFKKKISKFSFLQTKINKITFPTFQLKIFIFQQILKVITHSSNNFHHTCVCVHFRVCHDKNKKKKPFSIYKLHWHHGEHGFGTPSKEKPNFHRQSISSVLAGVFFSPRDTKHGWGTTHSDCFSRENSQIPQVTRGEKKDENTNKCKG